MAKGEENGEVKQKEKVSNAYWAMVIVGLFTIVLGVTLSMWLLAIGIILVGGGAFLMESILTRGDRKLVMLIMMVLITGIFLGNSYVSIGPGERGVVIEMGKVTGQVFGEGVSGKVPFIQNVVVIDIKTQKVQGDASAASQDLQTVTSTIALNYKVDVAAVASLVQTLGVDYKDKVIDPAIQESVKSATAQFKAEQLIENRSAVRDVMENNLRSRIGTLSGGTIEVVGFSIVNFDFSTEFNTAIEQKVTAEQLALKAERDLERIKTEAEQKVATATAEATAITIQAQALLNGSQVLGLRWIEKWNGQLPTTMAGDSSGILLTLPASQNQ
jgi:prohibitin 2